MESKEQAGTEIVYVQQLQTKLVTVVVLDT
jgi:hypothetical protein